MLLSVVIPTFNRSALLVRTLKTVSAQKFKDFEVIVVDDGSTDGTAEVVSALGIQVRLITQTNAGPGAGRNAGAHEARGEYLAFLDSDDWWFPWTLTCFADLIRRHEQPAIISAKLVEFSSEAELAMVLETPPSAAVFPDYLASHRSGFFVGAGMSVLRRDAFLKVGGFSRKAVNSEDHDLILRLGDAQGFVQVLSPVTLGWRRHEGTLTKDLQRAVDGIVFLVEQERQSAYPGGVTRAFERRTIVARHARSVTVACLTAGFRVEAWQLYRQTFLWQVRLGRWKYLCAFPIKATVSRA